MAERKTRLRKQIPVCILVRVSTKKQETARQITELKKYADSKGYKIVEICEESISGKADETERAGLQRALELAQEGEIKKVLVHEVSRIARKSSIAHSFVETLKGYGVSLYWHAQCIETLMPNGKRNPTAAVMFALLAEFARNERETMIERINSGLAEAKRKGKVLGRPKGTSLNKTAFLKKHADVVKTLKKGRSIRETAKITGKGNSTVQRVRLVIV